MCLFFSWLLHPLQPFDQQYIKILQLFGDSETSSFSIHNLLRAGRSYGLAAGSWVGPYAMCRSWETLARGMMEETVLEERSLPMALYIVSGDEDGERGGAPVLSIEDAFRHCCEFSRGQIDWTPILLLIPLVLGLEKVNPRYLPSLKATFAFPQSLGILGGKPGVSTYIVGVQEEKVFYLDPHDVQPFVVPSSCLMFVTTRSTPGEMLLFTSSNKVIQIRSDNPEVDTASYHCSTVRHIPLDLIDPSLAIGFYCRNKDDFDDFCCRAAKLADESNGAPLFTIAHKRASPRPAHHNDVLGDSGRIRENSAFDTVPESDDLGSGQEDEWQLL
ncbi:Peptidase C54, catalytic domain [Dillenia turbinata]|uniref:Cysteine protease n=1 Tax=Dillenia turbinata TaxID=194707 RepID=A0AAN8UCN9_9MAGN